MQIKISDGSLAEVEVGSLVKRTPEAAASPEEGALEVVAFDAGYPVVMISGEKAAISGDAILAVLSKEEPLVKVDLGGGNIVLVSAKAAAIINDMLVTQAALMQQIADLMSGGEVAELKAKVDSLLAELQKINELVDGALV